MKTILFFAWDVLMLAAAAFAQPNPDTLWTRAYGGSGFDDGKCIEQTADGGYVIAGTTRSYGAGGYDILLMKIDSVGATLWTHTYGGSEDDVPLSFQRTADGGYVITGWIGNIFTRDRNVYVVKTDSLGDTLWTRTYGGSTMSGGASIQQTTDGGYVIAGYVYPNGAEYPDFWLLKTNGEGDTLWTRTYGGSGDDDVYFIQQTTDSGYVMAGNTNSFGAGNQDVYIVKTDARGDTLWTRTYGGPADDWARSAKQTMDGGYIIAGGTSSFGAGSMDSYVVKTNSQGDTLWTRTYGGSGDDMAYSIQQTADGGYVIAGYTTSFGAGSMDFYVLRTNSLGGTLWTRTYGGSSSDVASSIQQTTDGGYVIAGETLSFGAGGDDIYVVKTGPDVLAATPRLILNPSAFTLSCSPNPFNPSTQIAFALPKAGRVSLTVSNLLGQHVATLVNEMQAAGTHAISFDGSALPSGIYVYRLQAGEFVQTKKMVLLK